MASSDISKAISRKQCKIQLRVQLMTNRNHTGRMQWHYIGPDDWSGRCRDIWATLWSVEATFRWRILIKTW